MNVNPNQSAVDVYTAFHVAWGAAMQRLGLSFWQAVALSLLWEYAIEPRYKDAYPEIFPAPSQDSRVNSLFDTAAVALGWSLARGTRA